MTHTLVRCEGSGPKTNGGKNKDARAHTHTSALPDHNETRGFIESTVGAARIGRARRHAHAPPADALRKSPRRRYSSSPCSTSRLPPPPRPAPPRRRGACYQRSEPGAREKREARLSVTARESQPCPPFRPMTRAIYYYPSNTACRRQAKCFYTAHARTSPRGNERVHPVRKGKCKV